MWLAFHLLTVAALAVLVEVACRAFRPRPAICHLLWLAVLIKLMTPPVVTWPWALPDSGGLDRFSVLEFAAAPSEAPAAPNAPDSGRAAASPAPQAAPQPFAIDLLSTGMGLWIAGACCAAALQAFRLRKLRKISRHTSPAPDWLEAMAGDMAQRLGVRPPRVLLAKGVCSAVALNAWRPKVLVSPELLGAIPREDFAGVLAHELAHLKRRDLWAGLFEFAAQCAWWWNPLLYVVRRRLHLYREMAADAWVLWALPDEPRRYAETLVRVVDIASRRPAPAAAFGMASGPAATFERRLAMVLEAAAPCRLPRITLAATLLLLVLIAPGWSSARSESAPLDPTGDKGPSSEPCASEPTMVAELRAWFVTSNVSFEADWINGGPSGNSDERFLALVRSPLAAGGLVIDGDSVIVQDGQLRWGENGKPAEEDAMEIFSATIGLRPGQHTLVKTRPLQAPGPLELSLLPEKDSLRAWIGAPQAGDTPAGSAMYLNVLLPTRQDQWQAAIISVPAPKGERTGVFILFYRVQTATPDLLKTVETGDSDDCLITHAPASERKGPYATAEFKIVEVSHAGYQKVEVFLKDPNTAGGIGGIFGGGIGNPAGGVYRYVRDPFIFLDALSNGDSELISAPRVTFQVANPPTGIKVLQREEDQSNHAFELLKASEAVEKFVEDALPSAFIADLYTETFVDRFKNKVSMHEGLIAAIAARQDEGEDTLALRVLVEDLRLDRHKRGLAFWKPRRLPDVLSKPVEVSYTCKLGDTVVFEAPTPNAEKHRLVLLTIDKADLSNFLPRGRG